MSYWNLKDTFDQDPAILAFPDYVESPYSLTLTRSRIPVSAKGKFTFPAGVFLASLNDETVLLPRVTVQALTATNSPQITVSPYQVLSAGDVLTVVEPHATVTLGGTWSNGETVTVTVDSQAFVYTVVGTPTSAQLGPLVASAINANPRLRQRVTAVANGAVVHIFAKDGISLYTLTVSEGSASGTIAASSANLIPNVAVGTVASVVNTTGNNGTVTLTGNVPVALPVGTHIGVQVDEIYGVYRHSQDLSDRPSIDITAINAARIWRGPLPYVDGDIERRLPTLHIRTKY